MKILKTTITSFLFFIMSLSSCLSVLASSEMVIDKDQQVKKLRDEINNLNKISAQYYNYNDFYSENKDWIDDINNRVEEYMLSSLSSSNEFTSLDKNDSLESLSTEDLKEVQDKFKDLLVDPYSRQGRNTGLTNYFDWTTYSLRNGYWTYSMVPRAFTRSNRISCQLGWEDLKQYYPALRSNNSTNDSLYWQYICHFDAFIEYEWNIEVGRPNYALGTMLLFFCNP